MKLSDLQPNEAVKILVFGDSGSGKTCFACGFPTPILLFDFDGKASSAHRYYQDNPEILNNIEVIDFTREADPGNKMIQELDKLNKILDYFKPTNDKPEIEDRIKWKNIIIKVFQVLSMNLLNYSNTLMIKLYVIMSIQNIQ